MTRQGWDLQLTAYAARDWRANFFPAGIVHSIVGGSGWEPTPWQAVQRAAWQRWRDDQITVEGPGAGALTTVTAVRWAGQRADPGLPPRDPRRQNAGVGVCIPSVVDVGRAIIPRNIHRV